VQYRGRVCPRARRERARQAAAALDTEKQRPDCNRNHAASAGRRGGAGSPRREIDPLFDNKIIDEKRKKNRDE